VVVYLAEDKPGSNSEVESRL